jgi:hypothetical protein
VYQVRIVGDVHGKVGTYTQLVAECPYSLQLGDLGFRYEKVRDRLSPDQHRFIPGNHDDYHHLPSHALGDYGTVPFVPHSFFVRGAYSIDKYHRTPGRDWWPEEELDYQQGLAALEAYEAAKPEWMFTHCAPSGLTSLLVPHAPAGEKPSSTQRLLQLMWELHHPTYWLFGHYHQSRILRTAKTTFHCLDELESYDLYF